jgi:dolichol kinase
MINYESTETIVLRFLAMKVCSYNATYNASTYLCILHIISLLRAFTKVRKGNISFLFLSICLFIYPSTSLSECSNFTATIQSFRFLCPCIVSNVWREREKKPTRCNNQMFIINFCLNMFRASLCPSSREQRPCVTAYGVLSWFCCCGALRCRMRALSVLASYNALFTLCSRCTVTGTQSLKCT